MNAIAGKLVNAYRDQFGVHGASGRVLDRLRNAFLTPLRRVSAVLRRPVTLEQATWLFMAALLIVFLVALIVGETGVGRGGR